MLHLLEAFFTHGHFVDDRNKQDKVYTVYINPLSMVNIIKCIKSFPGSDQRYSVWFPV